MTIEDAPVTSRRAHRESVAATTDENAVAPGTDAVVVRNARGRQALGWLEDGTVALRTTPGTEIAPDLLARRPHRSPLRPGVVVPILSGLGVIGAYAATTLLWPLWAVAPQIAPVALPDLVGAPTAIVWPAQGAAAVGVAGIDATPASTGDAVPMASITKLVTALMVLDQMPLAVGESGPSFAFGESDQETYYDYLAEDESALDAPVDGSLSQYQMLQGMLIGSAGNYTDRLASTIWPTDTVFAKAARAWLDRKNLPGITVVEPTGIDPANTADPASLITLARLALANPVIAEIVRTPVVDLPGAGQVVNTNDLLADPAIVGLKTGSLTDLYNLLAAKVQPVGDATLRVYAVALAQPDDAARDSETARLLSDVAAEASVPTVLPTGTIVGTVTTAWGATSQVVTTSDLSLLLWNTQAAPVASDLSLGDARAADAEVGTVSTKGPLGAASTGARLTADIPDPDPWWRLTHPLQLFGLAD
ncbi:MAG: D-alanyl-D-alanine carboxypeptidase [Microbacterium sp.]|uniref:D-alanyl-D-alanine carboxypeptidase n=1 Tax=Microbacterium sp. TaxID=51671 RepID=UPI001AD46765|nr:D-alanyl-D-alanine carboxypeptidase [Microbacterium sp.]MBN9176630.1 D-alanyl-D-alanine carboxypeptidase [Microbacterium sp.]